MMPHFVSTACRIGSLSLGLFVNARGLLLGPCREALVAMGDYGECHDSRSILSLWMPALQPIGMVCSGGDMQRLQHLCYIKRVSKSKPERPRQLETLVTAWPAQEMLSLMAQSCHGS